MRSAPACWSLLFFVAVIAANDNSGAVPQPLTPSARRSVAYFEAPRSVGTPLDDLARSYSGLALARKIEGRLRLETDASLDRVQREMIRRHLAQVD
ncbi:MAG TPA: hypothetical protein VKA25_09770 [Gemmatimonadales bacterium]|nr:hypothetical protein [Gemmatimonadales bacterium]